MMNGFMLALLLHSTERIVVSYWNTYTRRQMTERLSLYCSTTFTTKGDLIKLMVNMTALSCDFTVSYAISLL